MTQRFDPTELGRIVIKIGSSSIVDADGRVNLGFLGNLVTKVQDLHRRGVGVVLVSSGAIAMGYTHLGFTQRPSEIPSRQACAALGQMKLMGLYQSLFDTNKLQTAQVLLTREDMQHRRRYLNAREALLRLIELNVIPIVNENDSVAVEEIQYGDNDLLSALVAGAVDADLLVLLTNVEGLLLPDESGSPSLVSTVNQPLDQILNQVSNEKSAMGSGGMHSKLEAADICRTYGIHCVIAKAKGSVLKQVLQGEQTGTHFPPVVHKLVPKQRWIHQAAGTQGGIKIDEGASKAVLDHRKSLLPKGVLSVDGSFIRGAVIAIKNENGQEIARGVTRYNSKDLQKIQGCFGHEIESILGYTFGDEVVHCDNLVPTLHNGNGSSFFASKEGSSYE